MTRTPKFILLAVVVAALVAGCGGRATPEVGAVISGGPSTDSTPAVATAVPERSAGAKTSPTEQAGAVPAATPAGPAVSDDGEELSVADREVGLENLDSYRANWKLQWTATGDDKSEDVAWEWMQEFTREPRATHWRWEGVGGDATGGAMEFWQLGQTTYIVSTNDAGETSCISSSSDDANSDTDPMGPQTLGSVDGAKFVGVEDMNGIRARHYRYDEKSSALFAAGRVTGDIWVAVDGGFVVKDAANWEGGLFGLASDEKATGTGSWTWELTNVNEPLTILAPEGCESAASDVPILPDATEKATFGDMLTYKTATKQADVVQFYRDEMKKAGWAEEGEGMTGDGFANLTFSKDGGTLNVMVNADGDASTVVLTVQKPD